jgi:hypothetical protein
MDVIMEITAVVTRELPEGERGLFSALVWQTNKVGGNALFPGDFKTRNH